MVHPAGGPRQKLDAAVIAPRPTRRYRAAAFQIYVLAASAVFITLAVVAHAVAYFPIDLTITRAVQSYHGAIFDRVMFGLSWLGFIPQVDMLGALAILVLFFAGLRWESIATLFATGTTGLGALVKLVVYRPRPSADLVHVFAQLPTSGFPSGHVVAFTSFCGFQPPRGGISTMSRSNPREAQATAPTAVARHIESGASAARPWVEPFMRFGYIVRGVIYIMPGVLALQLALRAHGGAITQTGAIQMIGQQSMGRVLLIAVAVGLAGYALWGVFRAVLDPLHKGHSPKGLAKRFGFAMSALAYAGLFAATLRFLAGALPHTASQQDWSVGLLAKPFGAWLVGIIGLCWIAGAGIGEIARGWKGGFEDDLALERMGATERRLAVPLGRFGTVARGAVFTIIGMLLVAAALHVRHHSAGGLDGALLELARQPYGRVLLAAAALGLIAFGAFSVMCARWMRMPDATHAQHSRSSNSPSA